LKSDFDEFVKKFEFLKVRNEDDGIIIETLIRESKEKMGEMTRKFDIFMEKMK
jgi:hypothetical protein